MLTDHEKQAINSSLTEDEKRAIDMFLSEHWSEFEGHCATHGVDEDQIADKLNTD